MKPLTFHAFLVAAGLLPGWTQAHSWNEQLSLVDQTTGDYTGAYGYPRGYVARTSNGFNDGMMTYLIPQLSTGRTRVTNEDLLCHPSQRTMNQTQGFPRLQAAPGSLVAMKYLENGHVTLPQNQPGKPPMSGTVFVFGTSNPSQTEKIVDVMQWTYDGAGGDKRGRLLAVQNFDDGRCHQVNSGPISELRQKEFPDPPPPSTGNPAEQWCETDLKLPDSTSILSPGSTYTVYWIWQWPTAAGAPGLPSGKDEYYSTCSDLEVVAKEVDGAPSNTLVQQDPQTHAVSDYMSRTAVTSLPDISFYMQASWPVLTSWENFLPPAASGGAAVGTGAVQTLTTETSILTTAPASAVTTSLAPSTSAGLATASLIGGSSIGSGLYLPGFSGMQSNTVQSQVPSATHDAAALATMDLQITALPGQTFYLVKESTTLTYTMPQARQTPSPSQLERRIARKIIPPIDNSPRGTFSSADSGAESLYKRSNPRFYRSFIGRE